MVIPEYGDMLALCVISSHIAAGFNPFSIPNPYFILMFEGQTLAVLPPSTPFSEQTKLARAYHAYISCTSWSQIGDGLDSQLAVLRGSARF